MMFLEDPFFFINFNKKKIEKNFCCVNEFGCRCYWGGSFVCNWMLIFFNLSNR